MAKHRLKPRFQSAGQHQKRMPPLPSICGKGHRANFHRAPRPRPATVFGARAGPIANVPRSSNQAVILRVDQPQGGLHTSLDRHSKTGNLCVQAGFGHPECFERINAPVTLAHSTRAIESDQRPGRHLCWAPVFPSRIIRLAPRPDGLIPAGMRIRAHTRKAHCPGTPGFLKRPSVRR